MARLSVNVDHVATVRQARGIEEPDPVFAAALAELAGAEGIICHLREDRRHINDRDLQLLRRTIKTKLNMEMAAVDDMIGIAIETKPDLVTLVPERREELTTEGGLDVKSDSSRYKEVTNKLKEAGIEVSFFIDPNDLQIKEAKFCGADIVEIHTGQYAEAKSEVEAVKQFDRIVEAVKYAKTIDLKISAGHGLNYINIKRFKKLPHIDEYSIGHSIVSRSIFVGFERAVQEMLKIVREL
ncbi:pyridoxine 5'-phosphate synthase [Thermodesulfobacteriota bacterium]